MNVDRDRLPQWGWLLVGLILTATTANVLNAAVFFQIGLDDSYGVVTVIAAMSPVLIYVGIWHDEDRRHYWENSRAWIYSDVTMIVAGAALGAAVAMVVLIDLIDQQLLRELLAMVVGFFSGWLLFFFRNPEVYRGSPDDRR